jgi:ribokinase
MPQITVVGSINMDLVIKALKLPETGETVTGGRFGTFPGGKGANQAVAAARLGAQVTMVGCVGSDAFGEQLRNGLAKDGIDILHVRQHPDAPSGVVFITVDDRGQNTLVVAPGANSQLTSADVDAATEAIHSSRFLLVQLEIPLEVVVHAAEVAHRASCRVILDPAPARPLPAELYRNVYLVNPNEIEAKLLTGVTIRDERAAAAAAESFLSKGCEVAVIKLGERGAYVASEAIRGSMPAVPVDAVDSTAAGDAFAGALAVALAEGKELEAALRFANAAGALSVTRMGAQPSMPRRDEVNAFARRRGLEL